MFDTAERLKAPFEQDQCAKTFAVMNNAFKLPTVGADPPPSRQLAKMFLANAGPCKIARSCFVLSFIGTAVGVTRHVPMRHNAARAKSEQLQFCHEMTMAMRFGKMTT